MKKIILASAAVAAMSFGSGAMAAPGGCASVETSNSCSRDIELEVAGKVILSGFTGTKITIDETTKQGTASNVCIGTNNPSATGVQISATGAYTDSGGAKTGLKMGNAATTDTLDYTVKVNGQTVTGTAATLTTGVVKLGCPTSTSSVVFDVTTDLTTVEAQIYASTVTLTVAAQ